MTNLLKSASVLVLAGAAFALMASVSIADDTTTKQQAEQSDHADTKTDAKTSEGFAWVPSDSDVINFKVLRKGNDFGTHSITFSGDPEGEMKVRNQVSLKAGLGPITVFRYTLDATESWNDGVLVGLEGKTNDDGEKLTVSAEKDGDKLAVDGTEFSGEVDLGIVPSSHWNIRQVMTDRMISTEDGEILQITSEKMGKENVKVGDQTISATKYRLRSKIDLDLWYDDENRLVKLAFEARDQDITYVLQELY